MSGFLKDAWMYMYSDRRTRQVLEGRAVDVQDGDVRVVTGTIITDGKLVLWDPLKAPDYMNRHPNTFERITDCSSVLCPTITSTGYALPETIRCRMRSKLGKCFVLGMGNGYASFTSWDPDYGFAIEDGAPLECEGFLDGYNGEPFAHRFVFETVSKIMRRFDVRRVELVKDYGPGSGLLKFWGTYKGHEVALALMPAALKDNDTDLALDLVREWGKSK